MYTPNFCKFFLLSLSLILTLVVTCSYDANAQVWQWSVLFKNARPDAEESRAFMWIPDNCKKIKGYVLAQNNMEELSILENTNFRKQLTKLGFAEIWVTPPFDHLFNFNNGAGETFNNIINSLADISGYTDLKFAPVVPIGHSAAASWPYYFAVWKPERTLCAISVSGQWPYFRDPKFAPDIWEDKLLDFIPCLETMGEYETANTWSKEGLKEKAEHQYLALSMLACPAEGHFASTEKKVDYIALYIKKAIQYRMSNKLDANGFPDLTIIDPHASGWLVDKWRLNQTPTAAAAPVNKYKGDKNEAFWYFDEEMAKATEAYQASYRNKKAELIGYLQDGQPVKQRNSHLQVSLHFKPESDGISFKLKGYFLDTVPAISNRLSDWTGIAVDSPIGHGTTAIPVNIERITGPFKKINDSVFQLSLDKSIKRNAKHYSLIFAATHPGDENFKPAVQQAEMNVPFENTVGLDQTISFSSISRVNLSVKSIDLKATSSAGLPVHYYVLEGPAEVQDNKLVFTPIPPQSKFPLRVTVVAWQYGLNGTQKIKTAPAVSQTFYIDN